MASILRKVLLGVVVLVLILVAAVAVLWWRVDDLAKFGVEHGASYALGVPAHLGAARVSLLSGRVDLDDLKIENPPQFKTPYLALIRNFELQVRPASVMSSVIDVPVVAINGMDVYIEQKDGTDNASVISQNIQRLGTAAKSDTTPVPAPRPEEGPKVNVRQFIIRGLVAHVQTLPIGGKVSVLDVKIPELVLNDVTPDNAQGTAVAEVTRRVTPAIMAAIVEKGAGVIPEGLRKTLSNDVLATAGQLGSGSIRLAQQVGGKIGQDVGNLSGALGKGAGDAIGSAVGGAGKAVGGAGKGLGDAVGGLLGDRKKK